MKVKSLSRVRLLATPWAVAYQALQSVEFCRQEDWSGLPFTSHGDLPDPGIEPGSLHCRQNLYPLSYGLLMVIMETSHKYVPSDIHTFFPLKWQNVH